MSGLAEPMVGLRVPDAALKHAQARARHELAILDTPGGPVRPRRAARPTAVRRADRRGLADQRRRPLPSAMAATSAADLIDRISNYVMGHLVMDDLTAIVVRRTG
jgi:hypothetical protein